MRILLAYDGSTSADAAVDQVSSRPWPPGSLVRLVTVVDTLDTLAGPDPAGIYVPVIQRLRASLREKAYDRVHQVLKKIETRTGLETSCEVREGRLIPTLLEAICEWHADLAVCGSSGGSGAVKPFVGRVPQALMTRAPCTVEIVPPPSAHGAR